MTESMSLEENLKKKLEAGDITQEEYDNLIKKFGDLDLLSSRVDTGEKRRKKSHKWRFTGSASVEGDDVDGPVKVSGRLNVDGDLKCQTMRISGATNIDGDLSVVEGTKISGSLRVNGEGKFGGSVRSSGKIKIDKNLYLTGPMKISGRVDTGGEIIAGEPIKVSGKIHSQAIRSKSSINLSGTMQVQEDVIAEEFVSSGGASKVHGKLQANRIEIARKYREQYVKSEENDNFGDPDDIDSLPDLGQFISNMVTKFIPISMGFGGSTGKPRIFEVDKNIEGSDIDISFTRVGGDIIGDKIIIGPEVDVDGTIKYRESIVLPEGSELKTEKIE